MKLVFSGILLSLFFGIVDYDILFLSNYDYGNCEDIADTEQLVIETINKFELYKLFDFDKSISEISENHHFTDFKYIIHYYNSSVFQRFSTQNYKTKRFTNPKLRIFHRNLVFNTEENSRT